jgi:hypothetical protein
MSFKVIPMIAALARQITLPAFARPTFDGRFLAILVSLMPLGCETAQQVVLVIVC